MITTSYETDKIIPALHKVQQELGPLITDAKNPHFNSTYATLRQCYRVAQGPCSKHGIVIIQDAGSSGAQGGLNMVSDGQTLLITMRLAHTSGQYIQGECTVPLGAKLDPQKAGSAITYARRYLLCAMLGLAPEDDDGNTASGRSGAPQKPARPHTTRGTSKGKKSPQKGAEAQEQPKGDRGACLDAIKAAKDLAALEMCKPMVTALGAGTPEFEECKAAYVAKKETL